MTPLERIEPEVADLVDDLGSGRRVVQTQLGSAWIRLRRSTMRGEIAFASSRSEERDASFRMDFDASLERFT